MISVYYTNNIVRNLKIIVENIFKLFYSLNLLSFYIYQYNLYTFLIFPLFFDYVFVSRWRLDWCASNSMGVGPMAAPKSARLPVVGLAPHLLGRRLAVQPVPREVS